MTKKQKKQISNKLAKIQNLIEEISAHSIHPDESEMWDSDYYYNLAEQLKEALQLLENEETGILALLDDWESNKNYE